MTNVDFEDGVMTVNVELENESTFGRIATVNLDKAAKELINEHDKQIDKILKMEDDKDVRTVANMILQEYGENIRWKKQPKCVRTLRKQKLIYEIDTSISKRAKELREIFDIKEQKYELKDGDFVFFNSGRIPTIAIFAGTYRDCAIITYASCGMLSNTYEKTISYLVNDLRPATKREKKILIDQLAEVNKRWNAEKKCIEDVPRWRATRNERYYYVDGVDYVAIENDFRQAHDNERYYEGNYFKTREAAEKVAEQIGEIFKNSKVE